MSRVDVADRASVDAAFALVRAELGPVEILVTSAGVESFDSLVDTPMSRHAAPEDLPGVDVVGPMVPVGRAGTPEDIAAACSFLCAEDAGHVTGQVIGVKGVNGVNGGMYI